MNNIGMTGTRRGMTEAQKKTFTKLLKSYQRRAFQRSIEEGCPRWQDAPPCILHHGDCVGADEEAHKIARSLGFHVVIHPPEYEKHRAWCAPYYESEYGDKIKVREEKDYITRNHDIVDECDTMIGVPGEDKEILRSGTWSTIRYSQKQEKVLVVVVPDGKHMGL